MEKQSGYDLIPKDGEIYGAALGILIPAILVFIYFLITDDLVAAVDGAMFMIFLVGPFTGPLGMMIGAILVTTWRLSDEERKKTNHILIPRLGGVIGAILGFWIPAVTIFAFVAGNNGEFMVPGIMYAFWGGIIFAALGALSGNYVAKHLIEV